jgi:penicillin-binding protein 2
MLDTQFQEPRYEFSLFASRALFAALLVIIGLTVILMRLMYLQVYHADHYRTLSEDNRVRVEPLPPIRGLIYDRSGALLADNIPSYSLEIIPGQVTDLAATINDLATIIPINLDDRHRFDRLRYQNRRFDSIPIRLDLNEHERSRFAVQRHRFPGVLIQAHLQRYYPFGYDTAHLLGYVGRINDVEIKQLDSSNYAGTSHVGKIGLEKTYEALLHGQVGHQQVEVNARGQVLRTLTEQLPHSGQDLHLFLDLALQRDATLAMTGHRGALVAIDPNTGGILAMVSAPSFDPNLFVGGISFKMYHELRDSIDKPLYNRAIRGQYPPASTIKPFIGLAGLALSSISFSERAYCPGYYQLPGHQHKYRCWKRTGHGHLTMGEAITQSCDVYFYRLAHDIGIERLASFLTEFSFGGSTGVDLTDELHGLLPTPSWKTRVRHQPWFPGETLIIGIGQGAFLATPLQLAAATAAIANRGSYIQPRVVNKIYNPITRTLQPTTMTRHTIASAKNTYWEQVINAMADVVEDSHGTARRIYSPAYRIAGKTGTAQVFSIGQNERYNEEQVAERMRDHALFIAFAPVNHPQIAVAVIIENGRHGGSVAAPIARIILDSYLLKQRLSVTPLPAASNEQAH